MGPGRKWLLVSSRKKRPKRERALIGGRDFFGGMGNGMIPKVLEKLVYAWGWGESVCLLVLAIPCLGLWPVSQK